MPNGYAFSLGLLVATLSSCAATSTRESIAPADYDIAIPAPAADSSHLSTSGPSDASMTDALTDPTTGAEPTLVEPAPTFAVDDYKGPRKGRNEITFAGAGSNDKEFDNGGFNLELGYGHYVTEALTVGLRQNLGYSDFGGGHNWNGATRVFADFNFGQDDFIPFVGANFGGVYGETVVDTFEAAPEAGIKWYLREEVFVQFLMEYQFFFDDSDNADEAFDEGQFVYSVGIGFSR